MLFYGALVLWTHAVVSVPALPVVTSPLPPPPPPPQNIHVEKWLLRWTPATEERNITYSVQYRSFDSTEWKNVSACFRMSSTSCNMTSSVPKSEHGCVMLRVRAERHGLKSKPVQACSRQGDTCTPEVSLTARPGSLTVYVSRSHSLVQEYGDHIKNRVYYGKDGESLQEYKEGVSSVPINNLEEGQRYCAKVQYIYFTEKIGLESCTQCEVIPGPSKPVQTEVMVVGVVIVLAVTAVTAYVLICHRGKIKRWLRPPYEMPEVLIESYPKHRLIISPSSPSEEHYDVISSITAGEIRL
ncbi:hypothetical protein INR49_030006 [Caranx melampygus]|nr:hypothetical protein INR49_030006 [Caranx melampygus]